MRLNAVHAERVFALQVQRVIAAHHQCRLVGRSQRPASGSGSPQVIMWSVPIVKTPLAAHLTG